MPQKMGEKNEQLIRKILDQILSDSRVNNIKINQNIPLKGKRATHLIDIYWEFRIGEKKYSAIVEVKALSEPVDQETLFQFVSVFDDLYEQFERLIGIFVSNTGFRKRSP